MLFGWTVLILAAGLSDSGGSASTMSRSNPDWCRVAGAKTLPAELADAATLCAELAEGLGEVPPPRLVTLTVVSPSLISAEVVATDGRRLPAITLGRSDRPLSARAVRMLGAAIGAQLAARPKS